MCSVSSKAIYLLAAFALLPASAALAETGVVSAVGSGRDAPDAIASLLKSTVEKYFREEPPQLTKNVLQSEILQNASSFVQSYRILEGSKASAVTLSANVDLDVIHGLLGLTPKNIGEAEGAGALVVVRSAKLPDSVLSGIKAANKPADPFQALGEAARERFQRREFEVAPLAHAPEAEGDDQFGPEALRAAGLKSGARVALLLVGRFETYENENSHNREERLALAGTLIDVKTGALIAKSSVSVVPPKSRREQYVLDIQRSLLEESKELFQDLFVAAGRKLAKAEVKAGFSVLRVRSPSNNALVQRFRAALEAVPGIRSVSEYSVRRGKFDLAVRPALSGEALSKAVASLQVPELTVAVLQPLPGEEEARPPELSVKLAPGKEGATAAPPAGKEAQHEEY